MGPIQYPLSKQVNQVDDYHGEIIADPYRWLEDVDSDETQAWVQEQNRLTISYLEKIPGRAGIKQRLTELMNYPRAAAPFKIAGRYFQLRNTGLQNQDVLYVLDSLDGKRQVLLDPNLLTEDSSVALVNWKVSPDGQLLAYATSSSGSDWQTWRIRDINTGRDMIDILEWCKFSNATWLPDSSGFFYTRYDPQIPGEEFIEVTQNQKLFLHKIGEPQSVDHLVYSRPDQPQWGFDTQISDDDKYLLLTIWQGTETRNWFFYVDLFLMDGFIELIHELEASYQFLGNDGPLFYFRTDYQAPLGKVIVIDINHPQKSNWSTIIPEAENMLESVYLIKDELIAIYLQNAHHKILLYEISGNIFGEIPLPSLGSLVVNVHEDYINGKREDDELFFLFHSFVYPPSIFRYDLKTEKTECLESPIVDFPFEDYTTEQVFASSKDGTKIPMFMVHRKDISKNQNTRTLLYGYGGFNISLTPSFMINRLVWLEQGSIFAMANLRGGGEYGEDWHQAGSLHQKQNTFDDMIACADYLISTGYTSSAYLAIEGRSNGGLLVGACMTQRPDLFGAALPAVGVMDMLRFHKFTIGWAWVSDYGSPEDPDQFPILRSYSPLHNIHAGINYPATLITTADHDDRVVPGHSFKFCATLQSAQAGSAPILIRIQSKAGHGFGKPLAALLDEQGDILAFLTQALGYA